MADCAQLERLPSEVLRKIGLNGWGISVSSFLRNHRLLHYEPVQDLHSCRLVMTFICIYIFKKYILIVSYWQPFVGRELFAAGFVSCWAQLNETSQKQLVRSLEMAFSSPNIPPEILATLLNLVCFFSMIYCLINVVKLCGYEYFTYMITLVNSFF